MQTLSPADSLVSWGEIKTIASGQHSPLIQATAREVLQRMQQHYLDVSADKGGCERYVARALRQYFEDAADAHQSGPSPVATFLLEYARHPQADPVLKELLSALLNGVEPAQLWQWVGQLLEQQAYPAVAVELTLALFAQGMLSHTDEGVLQLCELLGETLQAPHAIERLVSIRQQMIVNDVALPESPLVVAFAADARQRELAAAEKFSSDGVDYWVADAPLDSEWVSVWLGQGHICAPAGLGGGFQAEYFRRYGQLRPERYGFLDQSFVVVRGEVPVWFCQLTTQLTVANAPWFLSCYALDDEAPELAAVLGQIVRLAELRVVQANGKKLVLSFADQSQAEMPLLLANYTGKRVPESVVDLSLEEPMLWRGVRKSFKSLVSKVRQSSTILYFNREQPTVEWQGNTIDAAALEDVLFYLVNMDSNQLLFSRELFACYRDWIATYGGEIAVVWHHEYGPVAASIITDYFGYSYYCWGRSAGPVLDPLTKSSHLALWDAIIRSKQRGNTLFNLGSFDTSGSAHSKLHEIAKFKHGFATGLRWKTEWSKVL